MLALLSGASDAGTTSGFSVVTWIVTTVAALVGIAVTVTKTWTLTSVGRAQRRIEHNRELLAIDGLPDAHRDALLADTYRRIADIITIRAVRPRRFALPLLVVLFVLILLSASAILTAWLFGTSPVDRETVSWFVAFMIIGLFSLAFIDRQATAVERLRKERRAQLRDGNSLGGAEDVIMWPYFKWERKASELDQSRWVEAAKASAKRQRWARWGRSQKAAEKD